MDVYFKDITDDDAGWYVDNEKRILKFCGYIPLGKAAIFIDGIVGNYNTLFGISPGILFDKLRELGIVLMILNLIGVVIYVMKVITIKQPFATLIKEGYKEYEFRTWKTKYRGEVLIHAGKSIDKKALERFKDLNLDYPVGQIIAKATITDCIKVDDKLRGVLAEKDLIVYKGVIDKTSSNWDGYAFKLENIEKVSPVLINGKLGFWDYDYEKE